MSEYQYYEFQAINPPLSDKEIGELRSYSTRARITPTSFVNDCSRGDFRGDADACMEKYFDAFQYLANWGTHVLKLRLPCGLLDLETAQEYCGADSAFAREKAGKVTLSFVSEDEEGGEWVEGEGLLSSLIAVRADLARGDLRALYLGWLLCAQSEELNDGDTGPSVPPGLGDLSASLDSLASFLRIDRAPLHVAAQRSPSLGSVELKRSEVNAWVARLPTVEKDEILASFIVNADHLQLTKLIQRFLKQQPPACSKAPASPGTVGELLRVAKRYAKEERRIEAENQATEKAHFEFEAVLARKRHLDKLAGCESKLWTEVESLIGTKQAKSYGQAVEFLVDLRDLDGRGKGGNFQLGLEGLRQAHSRKPSLIKKAGLR